MSKEFNYKQPKTTDSYRKGWEKAFTLEPTDKDWKEDHHLENGNYMNRCLNCGDTFMGHKRRVICKECV